MNNQLEVLTVDIDSKLDILISIGAVTLVPCDGYDYYEVTTDIPRNILWNYLAGEA